MFTEWLLFDFLFIHYILLRITDEWFKFYFLNIFVHGEDDMRRENWMKISKIHRICDTHMHSVQWYLEGTINWLYLHLRLFPRISMIWKHSVWVDSFLFTAIDFVFTVRLRNVPFFPWHFSTIRWKFELLRP